MPSLTGHPLDTSIPSLSQRVSPFGFEKRSDCRQDYYGDSLCIDNLFTRTYKGWSNQGAQYSARHLELDPFPLPDNVKAPAQQRLQAVTVCYCDGSKVPTTHGIALEWDATYGQLAEGVKKQCKTSQEQEVVLALLYQNLVNRFAHVLVTDVTPRAIIGCLQSLSLREMLLLRKWPRLLACTRATV